MREHIEIGSVDTSKGAAGDRPLPKFGVLTLSGFSDLAIALCGGANIFLA
jgi:hypothetical protein